MDTGRFREVYETMRNNIEEIKTVMEKLSRYSPEDQLKLCEKIKYLFYGLAKNLVDIGNKIIVENDYREPLNNADVFISLAEHDIINHNLIPGLKKTVLAIPKVMQSNKDEILALIKDSMESICKCLDSFAVYYDLKDKGV
ncbi:MAG: hypothetical protein N3A65_04670 [candidate division WOR-3 bacterium]|nr:hypothetical protein [candidate division WOR-3 bacterium]